MGDVDVLVVLTTFPSSDQATTVADLLVEERLAACVNVLPGLTSIYRWQGGVARDVEVQVVIKTTRARFDALAERLKALHPYELPELIALAAVDGSPTYLEWVRTETRTPRAEGEAAEGEGGEG